MNVYEVLHEEHVQILALLRQALRASFSERRRVLDLLIDELSAYTAAERDVVGAHAMVEGTQDAHLAMTQLMAELWVIDVEAPSCAALITLLTQCLADHVAKEECALFFWDLASGEGGLVGAPRAFHSAKAAAQTTAIEDRLIEALAVHYLDDDGGQFLVLSPDLDETRLIIGEVLPAKPAPGWAVRG